jgi:uncharacterized protein DUF4265
MAEATRTIVAFPFENEGGVAHENLHVIRSGLNRLVVDNSPFYVYGISFGDVVTAVPDGARLLFDRVIERGGHSTYRIKLPAGTDHRYFLTYWPALEALGCSYEGSSAGVRRLYAIDVPPEADIHEVYRMLEEGENEGRWEFEEGHYCSPDAASHVSKGESGS